MKKGNIKNCVEGAATLTLQNTSDNSLSQLNELTLQEFLDTYKSKDNFNLLGLKGGKWLIPKCNQKVFYNLLAKAIQTNKRKLYYVEYPLKGSNKVIIDADFEQITSKRLYTKDTIETLLKLYETEIRKHINKEVVFIVSQRDKPYKKLNKYKDGFHAIAPHIRLPTKILEEIRINVLEQVEDLFNNFENIKEYIIDKAVISRNGWQPIGCYKPTKKPYEVTYIYENGELRKPENKIKDEDYGKFLYSMSIWNNEIDIEEDVIEDTYESQSVTYSKEEILEALHDLKIQNIKLSSNSRNTYDVDYDHTYPCPVTRQQHDKIKCYIYENESKWLFLSCYSTKCSKKFKYLIKNIKINEEFFTDYNLGQLFVKLYGNKFIYQNNTLYYFNSDVWNSKTSMKHLNSLLSEDFYLYCSKLIINNTNEDERLKKLSNILNLQSRKRKPYIISEIKDNLTLDENIVFDTNDKMKNCLNFKNGLLELNKIKITNNNKLDFTDAFRKRTENDYVTQFLNYNFQFQADSKIMNEIDTIYSKINPNTTEKEFIYSWFAYCLTGITNQQVFLTSIGYSSQNGKSTQSKIHSRVLPLYSHKLDKRTFNINYSKQHKQIIHFDSTPIRYVYIEELDQKQLDQSLLKDFVDGDKINCEIMYGDSKNVDIQCKLNICSNVDPNFGNVDKGILRRGLMIKYNQRFLPKDKYEKELKLKKKNIHLRIDDIEDLFNNEKYKNAYLHLLLPFVVKFFKKEFIIPENIKNKFVETAEEYDTFKNIIDKYFTITDDEEDRIHKSEYIEIIRGEMEKNVSWKYILSETKRIGLIYNRQMRINGLQGVILGIKKNVGRWDA
jgi:hypothetical protein